MIINLSDLLTVDGKECDYTANLDMAEFVHPSGLRYRLAEAEPVEIHGHHTQKRIVELKAHAKLSLEMACDRCLEPMNVPFDLQFEQTVDLDATSAERAEALDEQPYISGYELDVDCLVYGELLLNLPTKVLCSQDCKGICKTCGANRNKVTCECSQEEVNLRMSVIQDIFNLNNFKEV